MLLGGANREAPAQAELRPTSIIVLLPIPWISAKAPVDAFVLDHEHDHENDYGTENHTQHILATGPSWCRRKVIPSDRV